MTTTPHPDNLPPLPESLCIDYVCEAAVKESRERYTLNTSRTAFQAGALFACRLALAQARPVPLTDEQIISIMHAGYNCEYNDEADHIYFARAIEAAQGIWKVLR